MNLFRLFPLPVRNLHRALILCLIPLLLLFSASCSPTGGMKDPTVLYASPYTAALSGEACGLSLTLAVRREVGSLSVTVTQDGIELCFSAALDAERRPGRITLTASGQCAPLPDHTSGGIPAVIALLTLSRADLVSLNSDTISGQRVCLAEFSAPSGPVILTLTADGIPLRLSQPETGTVLDFSDFTPLSA